MQRGQVSGDVGPPEATERSAECTVDILALDSRDNYVVIELKVSRGYDRVVGQLLRYMAWIEKNQADPPQRVRGVIVAREISEDLLLAASRIPDVELFEYKLSVTLEKKEA